MLWCQPVFMVLASLLLVLVNMHGSVANQQHQLLLEARAWIGINNDDNCEDRWQDQSGGQTIDSRPVQ